MPDPCLVASPPSSYLDFLLAGHPPGLPGPWPAYPHSLTLAHAPVGCATAVPQHFPCLSINTANCSPADSRVMLQSAAQRGREGSQLRVRERPLMAALLWPIPAVRPAVGDFGKGGGGRHQ